MKQRIVGEALRVLREKRESSKQFSKKVTKCMEYENVVELFGSIKASEMNDHKCRGRLIS